MNTPPPALIPPPPRHFASIEPGLAAFIDALPKTETHLHIDGALSLAHLRTLDPGLPERPYFWDAAHRYADFGDFLKVCHRHVLLWLTSPERCAAAVDSMLAECAAQNVRYVETSLSLGAALRAGPLREVLAAIRSAAERSAVPDVRLFVGFGRADHLQFSSALEEVLTLDGVDGIDLHGVETLPVLDWTVDYFQRARAAGKFTKVHAGEIGPAAHVRHAVEVLGVNRIEHGARAAEDPEVVRLLVERGITLDVCPISNLKLRVTPSLRQHPLAALHRAGVACTLNTDDPFCFGNTLREEYAACVTELGLDRADLVRLARNGFSAALLPADRKAALVAELEHVAASFPARHIAC